MPNFCANHPDKEANHFCAKYSRYLCDDCLKCQDPTLYCRYRTMCLIWEFTRHGTPDEQRQRAAAEKQES